MDFFSSCNSYYVTCVRVKFEYSSNSVGRTRDNRFFFARAISLSSGKTTATRSSCPRRRNVIVFSVYCARDLNSEYRIFFFITSDFVFVWISSRRFQYTSSTDFIRNVILAVSRIKRFEPFGLVFWMQGYRNSYERTSAQSHRTVLYVLSLIIDIIIIRLRRWRTRIVCC